MIKQARLSLSTPINAFTKGILATLAVVLFALPVASNAQQTSADVRGAVTDEGGMALANATVIVRNEATGLTRSTQTNANGEYNVRNLPVGINYSVSASIEGYGSERSQGLTLNLGETSTVAFALAATGSMEEIVVMGTPSPLAKTAVGPNSNFGLAELQSAPAINRNIADVLRADPRIFVDESRGDINRCSAVARTPATTA